MPKMRLGAVHVLLVTAVFAGIMTVFMASQYLDVYRRIMMTEIVVDVRRVHLHSEGAEVTLEINITNPATSPFTISRIEYELHLNGKYMMHDSIRSPLRITPDTDVTIEKVVATPPERMFTIEEAMASGSWTWRISGNAHTTTFFGDTMIRFRSTEDVEPS